MIQIYLFYLFLIIWHLIWYLQEGQWHVHVASRGPWVFLLVVCDLCWTCRLKLNFDEESPGRKFQTAPGCGITFSCVYWCFRKSISQAKKFSLPNRTMNFRINVTYRNLYRVNFNFGHHPILGCFGSPPLSSVTIHPFPTFQDRLLQHPWFFFNPRTVESHWGRSTRRSAGNEDRNEYDWT